MSRSLVKRRRYNNIKKTEQVISVSQHLKTKGLCQKKANFLSMKLSFFVTKSGYGRKNNDTSGPFYTTLTRRPYLTLAKEDFSKKKISQFI